MVVQNECVKKVFYGIALWNMCVATHLFIHAMSTHIAITIYVCSRYVQGECAAFPEVS